MTAATAGPARIFGLTDRGRIAIDHNADLVLAAGDPLTDITATRSITKIWRAGTACDRHAFPGSPAETEQLAALEALDAQVAKVMAAIRGHRPASK